MEIRDAPSIFLAGIDRSGIGLLGEILECHPAVSLTRRTDFWTYYDGRFGDLGDRQSLLRCLEAMSIDRRMRVFDIDPPAIAEQFRGNATYDMLFAHLQHDLMLRRSAHHWGDKSLGAEAHATRILTAYPAARMVHVVRDPRDRFASVRSHRRSSRRDVGTSVAQWRRSTRWARKNGLGFVGRYLVVRYEDLVADTAETLAEVSAFLGLDPHPASGPPLLTTSVGRHRSDLSTSDAWFVQSACGRGMSELGYEAMPIDRSPLPSASRWARVPGHLVSATGYSAAQALRRRFGETPSARRVVVADRGSP